MGITVGQEGKGSRESHEEIIFGWHGRQTCWGQAKGMYVVDNLKRILSQGVSVGRFVCQRWALTSRADPYTHEVVIQYSTLNPL